MLSPVINNSSVLVLIVSPLLWITVTEAKSRPKLEQQITEKEVNEDGESRATGGILADPNQRPWLGTAWEKKFPDARAGTHGEQRSLDGFMRGHSIALPKEYHILHRGTGGDIIRAGNPNYGDKDKQVYNWAQHPAEAQVNVFQGPKTDPEWDLSLPVRLKDLGNSPFSLFNHQNKPISVGTRHPPPYPDGKPVSSFPAFELDKNNYGTECHAYTWSGSPKNLGKPLPTPSEWIAGNTRAERYHVKFPVSIDKNKCTSDGHCQVKADASLSYGGGFCPGGADRGIPVLCGKQQKLTYLLDPPLRTKIGDCLLTVSGYHVGHLIPQINAYDSKIFG